MTKPTHTVFSVTDLKRAVRTAFNLQLSVRGFEIGPDGAIKVLTAPPGDKAQGLSASTPEAA